VAFERSVAQPIEILEMLDAAARAAIIAADTLFVATSGRQKGVDISHRAGKSGFVQINGNTLTIPDYAGNRYFNTLGNLLLDRRAAMLFPDFANGDLLLLQGSTEIVWEIPPEQRPDGAERQWRLTVDRAWRGPRSGAAALDLARHVNEPGVMRKNGLRPHLANCLKCGGLLVPAGTAPPRRAFFPPFPHFPPCRPQRCDKRPGTALVHAVFSTIPLLRRGLVRLMRAKKANFATFDPLLVYTLPRNVMIARSWLNGCREPERPRADRLGGGTSVKTTADQRPRQDRGRNRRQPTAASPIACSTAMGLSPESPDRFSV
jgi:hypothetical protein